MKTKTLTFPLIRRFLLGGIVAASLNIPTFTQAAVVVTLDENAPTNIINSFTPGGTGDTDTPNNIAWLWTSTKNSSNRNVAFVFKQEDASVLESLSLIIAASDGGGGHGFTLRIRESSIEPTSVSSGTSIMLETGTADVATFTTSDPKQYLSFTLETPISLQANHYYTAIFIWDTGADSTKRFNIHHGGNSTSETSIASIDAAGGSSWTYRSNRNYYFYASGTLIPEPSITLLMLAPLSVLLGRRVRSKQ